jgi:FkbM family methyltransferase
MKRASLSMLATIRRAARRQIRHHPLVERTQQRIRLSPRLVLGQIGLEIDIDQTSVLIDCGANVGDVTSALARTGAQVYAFEPNPLSYAILSKRFSSTPNVKCFNKGVMDRDCTLTLITPVAHDQYDALDMTIASSFLTNHADRDAKKNEIACIDLSAFIWGLNKRIGVLKIDIEGAEIQVLNCLIDTKAIDLVDLVLVETHEVQQPSLTASTTALRERIAAASLQSKIRLDWI